jgi:hypothetical protein
MIVVRPTCDGDLPGLDALFRARFGHLLSAAAWRWKYQALPGEARSLVAVDGAGTVVAHGGALRLAARWRGGEGGIWQLADFAGSSSGLRPPLVALGRELLAGLPAAGDAPWIFGFPSERHFRLGERVFGYLPLSVVEPLAGPLSGLPPGDGGQVEGGDSCGDWAAAAWEDCAVFGVRRSAAFLNWRYWARPERYYRFYRLWSGGPGSAAGASGAAGTCRGWGLAVFAFVGDEAWAAELWLPPGGEWYAPMLAVAADLRAAGLSRWRFWPPPAAAHAVRPATSGHPASGHPEALGHSTSGHHTSGHPEDPGAVGAGGPRGASGPGGAHGAAVTIGAAAADPADAAVACLLARLGLRPAGAPCFVGCRGGAGETVDPRAAAAGFYYAMGDYDLV